MSTALDVVAGALILAGCLLTLFSGIGLVRFPDVLSRMHAATKPQTLGLLCVVAGAAVRLHRSVDVWMLLLVAAFQLVTAPVSGHLVARMAYRTRHVRTDLLVADELRPALLDAPDGAAVRRRPARTPERGTRRGR
ncbi:monovalent cation/H(+) antiporter subunit G [Motilibacter aurantiacus]|uniref:monovalent cation/H(+) antiporter subunit G n=1 Tax=Motilibacter aurantiacus TaxID=2714955 RepID=UPI00140B5EEB|nr:monovalent cation/H(+) antiporter subunit G [Motilibacter aurantiacus]